MVEPRTTAFSRIARRITWIAWTLLACAAVAFVWAIAFTKGVDALINVLLISLLGFLVPSLFVFWVAWVINDTERNGSDDDESRLAAPSRYLLADRSVWLRYGFAIAATGVAALARALLLPVLAYTQPYPTFYLAVAASAWYGGMGPALVANALSVLAVWFWFVPPTWSLEMARIGDIVGLGLFFAISITIAGMTSSLRAVRREGGGRASEQRARHATPEPGEARLRTIADEAPAFIWMTDAEGECVYVNRTLVEFTGRPPEQHLRGGWIESVHPDDAEATLRTFRRVLQAREAFSATFRVRRRDGVYRVVHDEGRPRFDAGGQFMGFIGAGVEIGVAVPPVPENEQSAP